MFGMRKKPKKSHELFNTDFVTGIKFGVIVERERVFSVLQDQQEEFGDLASIADLLNLIEPSE